MPNIERIKELNDNFRTTLSGGRVLLTQGILHQPEPNRLIERVRTYSDFGPDNDPHGEHDFGDFEENGEKVFWKIDYYSPSLDGGSEDPSDPSKTARVLTVMLASEY